MNTFSISSSLPGACRLQSFLLPGVSSFFAGSVSSSSGGFEELVWWQLQGIAVLFFSWRHRPNLKNGISFMLASSCYIGAATLAKRACTTAGITSIATPDRKHMTDA